MSRLDGEKHREPETSKQASDNSIFGDASQPVDIRGMQHRALASGKHTRAANRIRSPGLTFSHNLPEITIPRSRILMVARRSWFNYGRSGWALKEFQPSSLSYFSYFSFFFWFRLFTTAATWIRRSSSARNLVYWKIRKLWSMEEMKGALKTFAGWRNLMIVLNYSDGLILGGKLSCGRL